jgi:hypothetical protein
MLDAFRRRKRREGPGRVYIADPRFDDWEPVRDFEDLKVAQAWREHLESAGFEAALTADWPLDRFGRGDITLRVPATQWSEAEMLLSNLE